MFNAEKFKEEGFLLFKKNRESKLYYLKEENLKSSDKFKMNTIHNIFTLLEMVLASGIVILYFALIFKINSWIELAFISSLIYSSFFILKNVIKFKLNFEGLNLFGAKILSFLFAPVLLTMLCCFHVFYKKTEKLFILKIKEKEEEVKINVWKQEFRYKEGRLNTDTEKIPAIIRNQNDYLFNSGEHFYKGINWNNYKNLNFEDFKKEVDKKLKVENF